VEKPTPWSLPACAADGVRRHLVGEHADDVGLHRRDVVDAAHHERAERRDRGREQHQVGAHVHEEPRVEGGDLPVAVGADPHVGHLVAPVVGRLHALGAALDPLDRPLELTRGPGERDLLAVDLQLGAEAAAHLGGDRPHPVLADAQLQGQEQPQEVRHLGGRVHGQRAGPVVGQHAARLDRRARRAVVDHLVLDHDVGGRQRRLDVAAAQRPLVDLVGAQRLVDERAALQRGLDVGDHRQRVVLDDHLLGGVDHGIAVLADHQRHGVAHVVDLVLGQRPVRRVGDVDPRRHPGHRQRRREVDVVAGEHGVDARERLRARRVDRDDLRVCFRRADERRPQLARDVDVVDVAGAAHDQPRVLLALEGLADPPGGWLVQGGHAGTSWPEAAITALTMLW
jgi:hypothetical protein